MENSNLFLDFRLFKNKKKHENKTTFLFTPYAGITLLEL